MRVIGSLELGNGQEDGWSLLLSPHMHDPKVLLITYVPVKNSHLTLINVKLSWRASMWYIYHIDLSNLAGFGIV
jgi:hypothetical protein